MSARIGMISSGIFLGVPGVLVFIWGLLAALVSFLPGAEVDIAGSSKPIVGFIAGVVAICIGSAMLTIPIKVWRKGKQT